MLPAPTVSEMATFTGRPETMLGDYAPQAILQATLMFSSLTELSEYPADPDLAQIAKFAILEMADRLLLEQPYAETRSGPFQTETIGSYSYSKITATSKSPTAGSRTTGLFWWETALDLLAAKGASGLAHGSIGVDNEEVVTTQYGPAIVNIDLVEAEYPPYTRIS